MNYIWAEKIFFYVCAAERPIMDEMKRILIKSKNGRLSYKIFADSEAMQLYLKNNNGKTCETMKPIFIVDEYKEYPNTQVRKLTFDEIQKYMSER